MVVYQSFCVNRDRILEIQNGVCQEDGHVPLGVLVALMQVPAPLFDVDEVIGIEMCDVGPLCPLSRGWYSNAFHYVAKET